MAVFTIIGMDKQGSEVARDTYAEPNDSPLNFAIGDMLDIAGVSYVEIHPVAESAKIAETA